MVNYTISRVTWLIGSSVWYTIKKMRRRTCTSNQIILVVILYTVHIYAVDSQSIGNDASKQGLFVGGPLISFTERYHPQRQKIPHWMDNTQNLYSIRNVNDADTTPQQDTNAVPAPCTSSPPADTKLDFGKCLLCRLCSEISFRDFINYVIYVYR